MNVQYVDRADAIWPASSAREGRGEREEARLASFPLETSTRASDEMRGDSGHRLARPSASPQPPSRMAALFSR